MKKIILAATLVFTTGILSTLVKHPPVKSHTVKTLSIVFADKSNLSTAD